MAEQEKVHFDLDALERDPKDQKGDFVAVLNGGRIRFRDPVEMDFRELSELDDGETFVKNCVHPDDVAAIRKASIPAWKFDRLMEGYLEHFGLNSGE